jgi:hypothetical protein
MKRTASGLWLLTALGAVLFGGHPAKAQDNCDTFLPSKGCKVTVDFTKGVHHDIAVLPGDSISIHVINKPRFATCSVAASPSALSRDLSSSFTTFLTTIGGLGAIGSNPITPRNLSPSAPPPNDAAKSIAAQYDQVREQESRALTNLQNATQNYTTLQDDVKKFWSGKDEPTSGDVDALKKRLQQIVDDGFKGDAEPSIASMKVALSALNDSVVSFRRTYATEPQVQRWLNQFSAGLDDVNAVGSTYSDYLSDLLRARAGLKQTLDVLNSSKPPYTSQNISLKAFSNKQVSLTLSCKDDITSNPSGDNIIFTAYYVKLPVFDLSAGVIFSLLGRHQVGTVGQTAAQNAMGKNPNGTFAVTDSSSFQVIPMALIELHNRGWKCRHFICTAGGVIGVGPNNATGSTVAEFFEGGAFAIQRVSFLVGFHDGRYETVGGGYNVEDPVPSAGYSPIITRYWTVHPAFGITYRIPLH